MVSRAREGWIDDFMMVHNGLWGVAVGIGYAHTYILLCCGEGLEGIEGLYDS